MPRAKTRRYDVLTIFPGMVSGYASESILGRAQEKKLISIQSHDLRDWALDKHRRVDDTPYGGGPGMVMKVDVFEKAVIEVVRQKAKGIRQRFGSY